MSVSLPAVSPLTVALKHCCPRCAQGRLFTRFLKVVPRCEHCHLNLQNADAADGPAVIVTLILGAMIVGLAAVVEFTYTPPMWVHILLMSLESLIGACIMLPFFKALLIAVQYRTQSGDCEDNRIEDQRP